MAEPMTLDSVEEETVSAICGTHGEYKARVMTGFSGTVLQTKCPQCSEDEAALREREKELEDFREQSYRVTGTFHSSAVPLRFKNKSFDCYKPDCDGAKKALATCRRYAETFGDRLEAGGGMVFCGKAGTGKTHLASSIIKHLEVNLFTSAFMSVISATRHVKETYSRDCSRTESEAIWDFTQPDLLVLDEVGVQYGTESEKIILFEIVNQRYQYVKPTILISNLTLSELSSYVGERVIDRMYEGGGAVLSFDWDSHRKARA